MKRGRRAVLGMKKDRLKAGPSSFLTEQRGSRRAFAPRIPVLGSVIA